MKYGWKELDIFDNTKILWMREGHQFRAEAASNS